MTSRDKTMHVECRVTPARLVALVAMLVLVLPLPPAGADVPPLPEPAQPADVAQLAPAQGEGELPEAGPTPSADPPNTTTLDPNAAVERTDAEEPRGSGEGMNPSDPVPGSIAGGQAPTADGATTTTMASGASPPSTAAVLPEPSPSKPAEGPQLSPTTPAAEPPPQVAPDTAPGPAPRRTTAASTRFPAHLRAMTDSVVRSASRSTAALADAVDVLEAGGTERQDAARLVFGRFPVAGLATYSHDWWFPRFGPGWRLHQGTDIFAPYGTPVRTPVDGIVSVSNGALGGLSVRVTEADGTFWYLAHLSAVRSGLDVGSSVKVGDVVGYVGNSGNARMTPPHLHVEIHPRGGSAVDPKATLDQLLSEAERALPGVLSMPAGTATQDAGEVRLAAPLLSPVAPVASAVSGRADHGETQERRRLGRSGPVLSFARPLALTGDRARRGDVVPSTHPRRRSWR